MSAHQLDTYCAGSDADGHPICRHSAPRGPGLAGMRVTRIDERHLVRDRPGADFVVFIHQGGDGASWSVDSLLLTDTDVPQVLHWLRQNLPTDSCWSLGVVSDPEQATPGRGDARPAPPGGPPSPEDVPS